MITGLDANILCYILDDAYPEHEPLKNLLLDLDTESKVALNPTTIHEAYHALVRSQKWLPEEAADALITIMNMPNVEFYNQTRKTSTIALNLSVQYNLGGRDALIAANFMANGTPILFTHDRNMVKLKKITWKSATLDIKDPLNP